MNYDAHFIEKLRYELNDRSVIDEGGIAGAGLTAFNLLRDGKSVALLAEELDATGFFEQFGWDLDKIRVQLGLLVLRASFNSRTYCDFLKISFENRMCFSLAEKNYAPGVPRKTDLTLRQFSPIRDQAGNFVDPDHLSHQMRGKRSLIDVYAARILRQPDPEGLMWFLGLPSVAKRMEGVERRSWLADVSRHNKGISLPLDMTERIGAWLQEAPFSFKQYYQDLLGSVDSTQGINKIGVVYQPEHTAKIGTELLIELLDSRRQDERYLPLTFQVIRDGADWYRAFMISAHGRGIVHDLELTPQSDPERLAAVMSLKGFTPGKFGALIRGVEEKTLIAHAKNQGCADELYKLCQRKCLVPLVSNKVRDSIFGAGLGL